MANPTPDKPSPIRPTDDAARTLARDLISGARFAALGVLDPDSGAPLVTRVAFATDPQGQPLTLISTLSRHTQALAKAPACSVLVGEPGPKGDPLTHPRLTLQCSARFVARDDPNRPVLRTHYLAQQPKAKLYIDFGDFSLVRLEVAEAHLNGGFGQAFHLTPGDLAPNIDARPAQDQ